MTIDELKMKVIDLEWAVMEKNSVDRRYFQQEIFDEITNLHVMLQASEHERDSWRERCEMQASQLMLFKKARYNGIYGMAAMDPTESRLDPADYSDLPFPDVEDVAPAEEEDDDET